MDVQTVLVCASIVGIIKYWIVPLWEHYQQQKFQREQEAQWELEAQAQDREIMRKRKQQQKQTRTEVTEDGSIATVEDVENRIIRSTTDDENS